MSDEPAYTESMNRLIEQFTKLPGIGRRTAERLAFHVLKTPAEQALKLARAIEHVKTNVQHCSICFNLTETDPCVICTSAERNQDKMLNGPGRKGCKRHDEGNGESHTNGGFHVF